jgi:S1-C subfamily serine protease
MSVIKNSVGVLFAGAFVTYGVITGIRNVNSHGVAPARGDYVRALPPLSRSMDRLSPSPESTPTVRPAPAPEAAPSAEPAAGRGMSSTELFAASSPSVVRVVAFNARDEATGFGSGFFVSADGLIATNYHVIQGAKALKVGREGETTLRPVRTVASDPGHDLALLKVDAGGDRYPALVLASKPPAIGTRVYAIGNPSGLTNTLSEGLVSGLRQTEQRSWIQATAAISPGSSGGPLLAEDGRVVGVNTMALRDAQNLNFAVPADSVRRLIDHPQLAPEDAPTLWQSAASAAARADAGTLLAQAYREAAAVRSGQGRVLKLIAEQAERLGRLDLCRDAAVRARTGMDQRDAGNAAQAGEFEASLMRMLARIREWDAAAQIADGMTDATRRADELLAVARAARAAGDGEAADRIRAAARAARERQWGMTPASRGQWAILAPVIEALDDGDVQRAVTTARALADTADPNLNCQAEPGADPRWNPRSRALLACVRDAGSGALPDRSAVGREIFDLADRERAVLHVVTVLAADDQLDQAMALGATLTFPETSGAAYCRIARARAKHGGGDVAALKQCLHNALQAAGKIRGTAPAAGAYAELVGCLLEAGASKDAAAVAERIGDVATREAALRTIAVQEAKAHHVTEACSLPNAIHTPQAHDFACQDVARELSALGDVGAARRAVNQIVVLPWRAVALRDVAVARAKAGSYAEARAILAETPAMQPIDRDLVLQSVAEAQADARLMKMAGDTAAGIRGPGPHAAAMAAIVRGCFPLLTPEEWRAWIEQYGRPGDRAVMFATLARGMIDRHDGAPRDAAARGATTKPLPPTKS